MKIVIVLILFLPSQEGNPLEDGIVCYNRLDYPCAVEKLKVTSSALKMLPADDTVSERLATALKYLGFAYVALGDEALAKDAFRDLLRVSPGVVLDQSSCSPKMTKVFDEVREELGIESTAPPQGKSGLSLAVASGAAFLSGRDAEVYKIGPEVDITAGLSFSEHVSAALSLDYHFHGTSRSDNRGGLHALGLLPCLKLSLPLEALTAFLLAGAGPSVFGRIHLDDKWAASAKAGGGVEYRFAGPLILTAAAYPNIAVTGESGSSFYLTVVAGGGARF